MADVLSLEEARAREWLAACGPSRALVTTTEVLVRDLLALLATRTQDLETLRDNRDAWVELAMNAQRRLTAAEAALLARTQERDEARELLRAERELRQSYGF